MKGVIYKGHYWIDPRTKVILLVLCVISAMMAPSLVYELFLVILVGIFGTISGMWKYSLKFILIYVLVYLFTILSIESLAGTLRTSLIAFLGLLHKVYPCSMMSGILITTTKVSEFISAMGKVHMPKKIVIPMAVMLRYIPTIKEDWHFIKDGMKMRDVSPSLKGLLTNPVMTIECLYVPLMVAASKAADELTIASITRGIENPKPRTCLVQIGIGIVDIITVICFLVFFIVGQLGGEVFL